MLNAFQYNLITTMRRLSFILVDNYVEIAWDMHMG